MNAEGKYGSPIMTITCFLINLMKMLSQLLNTKTIQYKNNIGMLLSITDQITKSHLLLDS